MKEITTEYFWDCECVDDHIHPKVEEFCNKCGASREEQPDSRISELSSSKRLHVFTTTNYLAYQWAKATVDEIAIETFYVSNMREVFKSLVVEGKVAEVAVIETLIQKCKEKRGLIEQNPAA